MKLSEIVEKLDLSVKTGANNLDVEISRGYVSDLLSDVIAHAEEDDVWVTLQIHQNIVAVATMKSLGGIILIGDRQPGDDTVEKAQEEDIPILLSKLPAFELVGRLYELGITGN